MPLRVSTLVGFVAAGLLLATVACGSSTGRTAGTETASATLGAEANTAEGIPVTYSDARHHYRIDAPGPMTANADGTSVYIGPSERMEISVIQGAGASNPTALANEDIKTLGSTLAAFQQRTNPAKLTLNGHSVTRFAYTWNAGTSTVTGKPLELTTVRYYVSKDASTLAVITYGIVSNQFDPQGADDIVSTFQWQ